MKRILHITGFLVLLFAGLDPAWGQSYFRVVGGVPHLPFLDPSSVVSPEPGMLIYSTSDLKPMIYTGTGWDSFCTNTINATSTEEYFKSKDHVAPRPLKSYFDLSKIKATGFTPSMWPMELHHYVQAERTKAN